ncbi:mechanosensitive ion channel family protein [Chryseobacterium taiwanense]|uniref:Mechanosensitive ion channel protein MscS n=1 Tax=Chryseobacterium taiwanense TaxID=363331 RepID=A0A0B4DGS1_9FLAO|nr:mechanosensitive ion channel domain-containing protein [Chryseobacterium taiwanense]KIC63635.1 mechanosensitive ion channel protein MscS [Chryseobacterium taiwanense]
MNDQLQETRNFIQDLSDQLYIYISKISPAGFDWIIHMIVKLAILIALFLLVDFILKPIINFVFRFFHDEKKYPIIKSIYESRVSNSVAHYIALAFVASIQTFIFPSSAIPKTNTFIIRSINLGVVLIFAGMLYRSLTAFRNYFSIKQDFYKIMALNAISETMKILGIFIFSIVGICVIFGIKGTTIVGSLGAITAVLVLVFRDTILGFVTGIHVATSKNMKVGDWIGIPKYNLEGTIEDITLLTTRIQSFDKTVSTIPTYDLMSTEVKNLQVMSESNTRRIKKSIIFNIKSFKFLDDEMFNKLLEINLLKEYLLRKKDELDEQRSNLSHAEKMINGKQLTNIGTFRKYAYEYLRNNKNIDQSETVLVRQMEITSQGLPLEIYCFTNDSKWEHFEQIQSDIFDHLLVASKEFDLEVMQVNIKI